MKPIAAYMGWAFAILFAGFAVFSFLLYRRADRETESLVRDYERLATQAERQQELNEALAETVERMSARLDEAQSRMEELVAATESLDRAEAEAGDALLRSLADLLRMVNRGDLSANAESAPMDEAARLMSGLLTSALSRRVSGAGAAVAVELHYGGFIDELELDANQEQAVRAALAEAIESEQAQDTERVDLRASLDGLLSDGQQDAFEAYRSRRAVEAVHAIVRTQLALLADELPAPLRERVADVTADAMLAVVRERGLPAVPGLESPGFLERYDAASAVARARIMPTAPEASRATLERFFAAQDRLVSMADSLARGEPIPGTAP